MGWQSYWIPFETRPDLEQIFKVVEEHNTTTDYESVGEELCMFTYAKLVGNRKYPYALLFGNGGGRYSTFRFFNDHKCSAMEFHEETLKHIVMLIL